MRLSWACSVLYMKFANLMANGLVLCDKANPPPPILRLDPRGRRHDRPCRDLRALCQLPLKDYSEMEAREAYERVAKFHGWPTQRRHS